MGLFHSLAQTQYKHVYALSRPSSGRKCNSLLYKNCINRNKVVKAVSSDDNDMYFTEYYASDDNDLYFTEDFFSFTDVDKTVKKTSLKF